MEIKRITYKEARAFLLPRHYSGRIPSITFAFGLFLEGALQAVCTFGKPASNALCEGVCGKEYKKQVYELNRLCRVDELTIPLSLFVGRCLKELKKENLIIVSYSDTGMHHNGYIYQATNFIYTGKTKSRTDKYTEGNKHSRHYTNANNHLRKVRTGKHRYIYFACNKTVKKKLVKELKYPIEPYPKEENKNYTLGVYQKTKVIDTQNETTYYV